MGIRVSATVEFGKPWEVQGQVIFWWYLLVRVQSQEVWRKAV